MHFSTEITSSELKVRFEQKGDVFDVPVTVTIGYRDGTTEDVVVALHERVVERTLPLKGEVRNVDVNRDGGALAEIKR